MKRPGAKAAPPAPRAGKPGGADAPPTVFVVDDDADLRASIALLMRSVRLPVRSYAGADEFLADWKAEHPGCLILDVRMPGMSGLELQALLEERGTHIPVVFLSGHGDIPMALRAVRAGALDFLEKPFRDQSLIDAVHAALAADEAWRRERGEKQHLSALVEALSPREAQVAALVADGHSSPEIARKLRLSPRTVEMHRARLMKRLGVEGVADVTRVILEARGASLLPSAAPARRPSGRAPRRKEARG